MVIETNRSVGPSRRCGYRGIRVLATLRGRAKLGCAMFKLGETIGDWLSGGCCVQVKRRTPWRPCLHPLMCDERALALAHQAQHTIRSRLQWLLSFLRAVRRVCDRPHQRSHQHDGGTVAQANVAHASISVLTHRGNARQRLCKAVHRWPLNGNHGSLAGFAPVHKARPPCARQHQQRPKQRHATMCDFSTSNAEGPRLLHEQR